MAMSKGVATGSIVIGCVLLVLTLISVICGVAAMSQSKRPSGAYVGLVGIYFGIPGVLSIIAGYKKHSTVLAVALGTHILGILLAIWGSVAASFCGRGGCGIVYAVSVIAGLVSIACFVGSIYGCMGTCCAPEPSVVITTAAPGGANTVIVTNSTQQSQTYGVQQPQAYGVQQPQAYSMQQPQAYYMQQPQAYGMQQPQAYGVQQPQAYGMEQPQPSGMQQPQAYGMEQPQAYGMQQPQAYGVQQPQAGDMQPPPYTDPGVVAEGQVIDSKY